MDNIHTVSQLITQNCLMVSIDLKDAYYSVKIDSSFQKNLKFSYDSALYHFTVFPNGLSTCPRKFTKRLKSALAQFWANGCILVAFIDDLYLQGNSYEEFAQNAIQTLRLFESRVCYPY